MIKSFRQPNNSLHRCHNTIQVVEWIVKFRTKVFRNRPQEFLIDGDYQQFLFHILFGKLWIPKYVVLSLFFLFLIIPFLILFTGDRMWLRSTVCTRHYSIWRLVTNRVIIIKGMLPHKNGWHSTTSSHRKQRITTYLKRV